jgi:hypothetical protein
MRALQWQTSTYQNHLLLQEEVLETIVQEHC